MNELYQFEIERISSNIKKLAGIDYNEIATIGFIDIFNHVFIHLYTHIDTVEEMITPTKLILIDVLNNINAVNNHSLSEGELGHIGIELMEMNTTVINSEQNKLKNNNE